MAGSSTGSTHAVRPSEAYRAAVEGNLETLLSYTTEDPMRPINELEDTVLHVLALNGHSNIINELLNEVVTKDVEDVLKSKNGEGNIALHEAARINSVEIAKVMVSKDKSLVTVRNNHGETPIFWASAYGRKEMFCYLASIQGVDHGLTRDDRSTILHEAVKGAHYDLALKIIEHYPDLASARNKEEMTALHLLAQSPSSFMSGSIYSFKNLGSIPFIPLQMLGVFIYLCMSFFNAGELTLGGCKGDEENLGGTGPVSHKKKFLQSGCPWLKEIEDDKHEHNNAIELVKQLIERESDWSSYRNKEKEGSFDDPLSLATKHGIVEIVEKILDKFPDAIECLHDNDKNILHLAVEHRQTKVFEFLKSNFHIDRMVAGIDKHGNTPFHLAAKFEHHQPMHVLRESQGMTWEIFWYKRVERISKSHLIRLPNSDGKTAKALFRETHQKLLQEAKAWTMNITNGLMVISSIITTINFTVAFSVPGDYSDKTGLPQFIGKLDFMTFLAYESAALFFSLVALGTSISAHMSGIHPDDFYISLPFKYFISVTALFNSVVYTLTAFVQAQILTMEEKIPDSNYVSGAVGIVIASILMAHIYIDVMYPVIVYLISVLFHSFS